MKLYSDGVDVTGGNVKLTDMLTLTMELDADYLRKLTFLLDIQITRNFNRENYLHFER